MALEIYPSLNLFFKVKLTDIWKQLLLSCFISNLTLYEWFIEEDNLTSLNSICKIQFCAYLIFKHEYIIIIQLWSWLLHKCFMKLFMDIFYTNTHFNSLDLCMVVWDRNIEMMLWRWEVFTWLLWWWWWSVYQPIITSPRWYGPSSINNYFQSLEELWHG